MTTSFANGLRAVRNLAGGLMFVLLGSQPAHAALFAVDADTDQLLSVNVATGAATVIGATVGLGTPAGLAWDGTTMYTIDLQGGELATLNLSTGASTIVGLSGVGGGWQGIAASPSGALYGTTQELGFYSIDKTTGLATAITGSLPTLFSGLDFDSAGTLWAVAFNGAFGTLNTTTGAFTQVGTTMSGVQGLSFDAAGTAYVSNTSTDSLYTLDLSTGAATLVGPMGTPFVKGLEFNDPLSSVPEPAAMWLIGSVVLGFGMRRARQTRR